MKNCSKCGKGFENSDGRVKLCNNCRSRYNQSMKKTKVDAKKVEKILEEKATFQKAMRKWHMKEMLRNGVLYLGLILEVAILVLIIVK